ncbi:hypothetical protein VTJ04DRAFT_6266 [Mycothermus thermophilus]|uniref:uncharacterized protein n=1 Tax=Humicola insolens TaxID=85995 RepID=UPI003741EB59
MDGRKRRVLGLVPVSIGGLISSRLLGLFFGFLVHFCCYHFFGSSFSWRSWNAKDIVTFAGCVFFRLAYIIPMLFMLQLGLW